MSVESLSLLFEVTNSLKGKSISIQSVFPEGDPQEIPADNQPRTISFPTKDNKLHLNMHSENFESLKLEPFTINMFPCKAFDIKAEEVFMETKAIWRIHIKVKGNENLIYPTNVTIGVNEEGKPGFTA